MSKARVYELASRYGVDSKDIIEKLKSIKEYVKSASATVEEPVVRRLEKAIPIVRAAEFAPSAEPLMDLYRWVANVPPRSPTVSPSLW